MAESILPVVHITNHPDRAEDMLLAQFRNSPNLKAIARNIGYGVQLVEDEAFDVLARMTLKLAGGATLDQWGEVVNEKRGGLLDDDEYRRIIRVRVFVNASWGSMDEVYIALAELAEPFVYIKWYELWPAGMEWYIQRESFMSDGMAARVGQFAKDMAPAGHAFHVIEATDGGFGFEEDEDALGFGEGEMARLL